MGKKAELLSPYRVLDLTDAKGYSCGKILGDLGADVVKVEPPEGDPGRRNGPFFHDIPEPEKSLYWFAYNSNKRGITLNLETTDGKELFKKLVKRADFVIESYAPYYMDKLGLGYATLSKINPRVILTSITPFGQDGPYADFKAPDIVLWAMGGEMYLTGETERPPVRTSIPQTHILGGNEAAVFTLIAHYYRQATGEGQWIDFSIQQVIPFLGLQATIQWDMLRNIWRRSGPLNQGWDLNANKMRLFWPCKDGWVGAQMLGSGTPVMVRSAVNLAKWMDEEGFMAPDWFKKVDWTEQGRRLLTQEELNRYEEVIGNFFMTKTKAELYAEALKREIMLYPAYNSKEISESPQEAARDFWQEVEHPELGAAIKYPAAPLRLPEMPISIYKRPPLIGEHNEEIYVKELGLTLEELRMLKEAHVI